jgi:signal transduction histidine kinase
MLARLRIRQKLNLLLILPLIAVLTTTVPFVLERVDDARASAATAQAARAARGVGGLIQELQRERLLMLGYLTTGRLDRSTLVAQVETVTDDVARLRASASTGTELRTAAPALGALDDLRQRILAGSVDVIEVYRVYRSAVHALIEALRLGDRPGVDALGLTRLAALDALMRANEEASSVGAALVASVTDQSIAPQLGTALAGLDQQGERFRHLGARPQVELVDLVEHGQAGVRLRRLAADLDTSNAPPGPERATAALTVAVTYTDLRRIVQDRVVGDIATAAQSQAGSAQAAAVGVSLGGLLLFVIVVSLSAVVSRSISRPLHRLSRAAGLVADLASSELTRVADSDEADPAPPRLAAVEIHSSDEIGELAGAVNRVQATAALLLERQVITRRNVAVMFANVARRTQTLVGRQLMLIDELERTERDAELLEKLYRLDHVASRLRRSAEALLVVSGTRDEGDTEKPVPLADIVRSALAEIEGYRSVRLRTIPTVAVDVELVGDLRLVLAELLENATSFSPPGTLVDVFAEFTGDCLISVVDQGIGMAPERMAEENRRLVDRERLDVAPTTVLGLFVVGRLARRYGLSVRLEPTPGQGVTARVTVPGRLLVWQREPAGLGARLAEVSPQVQQASTLATALAQPPDQFAWFTHDRSEPTVAGLPTPPRLALDGLVRPAAVPPRDPGRIWPPAAPPTPPTPPTAAGPPAPSGRGGLARRVPGTHFGDLPPTPVNVSASDRPAMAYRDPAVERAELDDFLDGLARARPPETTMGDPE